MYNITVKTHIYFRICLLQQSQFISTKLQMQITKRIFRVPHGSLVWPLLFQLYPNDLPDSLNCFPSIMFPDKTDLSLELKNLCILFGIDNSGFCFQYKICQFLLAQSHFKIIKNLVKIVKYKQTTYMQFRIHIQRKQSRLLQRTVLLYDLTF